MFQYILFDLDGTLTDPMIGITSSVQYALKSAGIDEPDLQKLTPFIGPPLLDSFMEYYGFTKEQAQQAIEKYRERFSTIGLYENAIYPGIAQMLKNLSKVGIHLAVASSKPAVFVEKILIHFSIRSYFEVVVGSELDGRRTDKTEVVDEALRQLGITEDKKCSCAMVGDRRFDIEGAKVHGVTAIGVSYGYAQGDELEQAEADYVADTVEELEKCLSQEQNMQNITPQTSHLRWQSPLSRTGEPPAPEHSSFARSFSIISPILIYYVVNNLLVIVMAYLIQWLSLQDGFLLQLSAALAGHSTLVSALIRMAGMLIGVLAVIPAFRMENPILSTEKIKRTDMILLAVLGVTMALFINVVFSLLQFTGSSAAYKEVADSQFSLPMLGGILLYGIISPAAEEIVFRGVVYNRLRRQYPFGVSVLFSAILFGVYHGNLVQAVYGCMLGIVIALAYECYGSFAVPVLLHAMANVSVYIAMGVPGVRDVIMSRGAVVCLGLVSCICIFVLKTQYKKKYKIV